MPENKSSKYVWVIVPLCCLMVMISLGFTSSTKSIFITPVCDALEMDRSLFSLNETARYITTAVVNIFFGTLIYKFGAKLLIAVGFTSLIASMLTYSFASSVFEFCIGGVLLGLGLSFTTTTMVGAVVNKWCKKSKGTIMGLALASNGIGATIAIQILNPIIHPKNEPEDPDPFSYRNAYRLCAVILVVALVLILVLFKNSPNKNKGKIKSVPEKREKLDYASILKTPYFYPAAVFIFCAGMVLQSVYGIAAPIMEGANMDSDTVANVLSVASLLLFVTKFGVGFLYDKTGVRHTSTICYLSGIVAIVLLFTVSQGAHYSVAYVYTVFVALALPLETIMLPIYARELFGEQRFNVALGIFAAVNTAGYALGAPLANLCYDIFGNYNITLYISVVVMAIAFVIVHITISQAKAKNLVAEK